MKVLVEWEPYVSHDFCLYNNIDVNSSYTYDLEIMEQWITILRSRIQNTELLGEKKIE